MKNFAIGKRLFITFGVILALFVLTVLLSVFSLFSTGANFEDFYKGSYELTNQAERLKMDIQIVAKNIGYSMMEEDATKTAQYIATAQETLQSLREGTEYLRANFDGDMSIVDSYDNVMKSVMEDRDRVFELAANNQNQEAISLYFNNVMPGFIQANGYLNQIGDAASASATKSFNNANMQKNVVSVVLIVLSVVTFLITIAMASYIIRSITRPVSEMEAVAKEMAAGSLNVSIGYESQDEVGSLADSMRSLTGGIREIIEDIGYILGELAHGNFRVTSKCLERYIGDYVPIVEAMRLLRDNLNSTLLEIREASGQVALGSVQMANSAQGLAEGATEQAGAVEELTATVENVAVMAESSAENAQQSYEQVKGSAQKAEHGMKNMGELIEAMERISTTSKEIENIIESIEDIASQTNLLSLNASIEAARAGEAGRGFAVVADQIGKLAADSAQSAVNTRELIIKTREEVEMGNTITNKTSEAFEEVIKSMNEFAEVARASSDVSNQQYESLNQVRDGIEQISGVVQSNSAAAEQTSATSQELSAQADHLEMQVKRFQLLDKA